MPRNMIASNLEAFRILDNFCSVRGDSIRNSSQDRWIATDAQGRKFLKEAILTEYVAFSPSRAVMRFDLDAASHFCTIGFDYVEPFGSLLEADVDGGLLTALISEIKPKPRASTSLIRQYVEAEDRSVQGYIGHDFTLISSLFAPIKRFTADNLSTDVTWRLFFLLCVQECRNGESWISQPFADTLQSICELEGVNIPFRTLCRSIFDSDPATMFLALYRCIESLYAYTSAQKVINALGLNSKWDDVATALEDNLEWHPREESSLGALLTKADKNDLSKIFESLGEPSPPSNSDLAATAGRRIYRFRNGLVHFRPYHHRIDYSGVDWNQLCTAMAHLAFHIYYEVFKI